MLSLKRNGNSLAVSIFQALPPAYIYLLQEADNSRQMPGRISIFIVHANIVHHRELRLRISHRCDTAIDGFIIQVMRHCPIARRSSRRHNAAVLRYNEGNVGAAIVTPSYIRCAWEIHQFFYESENNYFSPIILSIDSLSPSQFFYLWS